MIIRQENESDFPQIYNFVKKAFQTANRSDGTEQDLVEKLRAGGNYIPKLALVAEDENDDGKLIGYVMLTKIAITGVESMPKNRFEILLLAPVAIEANRRNKEIGRASCRERV